MIRIAAGERLRLSQNDVRLDGWAVEARIYAEDPFRDFLPSIGRLTRYRPPAEGKAGDVTLRIDSGVVEGSDVSLFYDPMIAKLCAHAATRAAAIDAMSDALDAFSLDGIRHNIPFLSALMAHPRWREGRLSTAFIAEEFPGGFHGAKPTVDGRAELAAIAISAELIAMRRPRASRSAATGATSQAPRDWVLALGREHVPVRVTNFDSDHPSMLRLALGGTGSELAVETSWRRGDPTWRGTIDGAPVVAQVRRENHSLRLSRRGATILARLMTPRTAALATLMPEEQEADTSKLLRCPMPGLVVSIAVVDGQKVAAGETLAVVEAMKMENVLRAERAATIARVLANPGDSLAVDAVILEFA
jgi:propionyl-CoA carboxylase alpha chain